MVGRRRRPTRSTVNHQWQQVRVAVMCARGHEVPWGEWVRFSYASYQQLATCEGHMWSNYRIRRPNSTFSFLGTEADDVKKRQAGGDE